jgi:hypothetical protein
VKLTLTIPTDRLGWQNRQLADRAGDLRALDVLNATVAAEDDVLRDLDPRSADGAPG